MRGQRINDEKRAAVLQAALQGQGATEIGKEYKLSESTVRGILAEFNSDKFAEVREKKKERLVDLIEDFLRQSLKAATGLAIQVSTDKKWLAKQDAEGIGVLYGIIADKSVRILEAAERAGLEDKPGGSTSGDGKATDTSGESGGRSDEAGATSAEANIPTGIAEAAH